MISSPAATRRLLIPRWRSLTKTIASRELSSPAGTDVPHKPSPMMLELVKRLERWRREPAIITAAELVESAIVLGQEGEAINAARVLARDGSGATTLVRQQAARVLNRTGHQSDVPADLLAHEEETPSFWRERTRDNPHDALAWVELALAQISRGHDEHALRSMTVALQLAPESRHVLRSAARLFFHLHQPDRAHDLIRKNPATPHDPWLMAAEISLALSGKLKRSPMFMKKGLAILDENQRRPRQITELAGAVATTLLVEGNRKRGKRFFEQSMGDPTGNSLAQAEWASQSFTENLIQEGALQRAPDASEARALHAFTAGDFEAALAFSKSWIEEEPFSSRAYLVAAVAASCADNFTEAEALAQQGLSHDPTSVHLLNSRAFSLASLDRWDDAEEILRRMPTDRTDRVNSLVAEANSGLIAMRRGDLTRGEELYRKVISGFRHQQNQSLLRAAQAYFAREAVRAGFPNASQLIHEAKEGLTRSAYPLAARVLKSAEELIKAPHVVRYPLLGNSSPSRDQ